MNARPKMTTSKGLGSRQFFDGVHREGILVNFLMGGRGGLLRFLEAPLWCRRLSHTSRLLSGSLAPHVQGGLSSIFCWGVE